MIEEFEKATEQSKYNQSIKKKILEKQKTLEETHNTLLIEEEKLIKSRADIQGNIQNFKEKIEEIEKKDAMQNNTKTRLNKDSLSQQCKKAIGNFLTKKDKDNISNMRFKIEYKGCDIIREIEDENMTFKRLKIFFKHQFNKSENDFFFADKDDRIYLDEMNISKTLFPFSTVLIKGHSPVIKVIEKVKKINHVITNKEPENNLVLKDISTLKFHNYGKYSEFKNFFSKIKYIFISIILFVIFLFLWTESCVSFRQIKYYNDQINAFEESSVLNFDIEVNRNIYL